MQFITVITALVSQFSPTPIKPSSNFAPAHQDYDYKADMQQFVATHQKRQGTGPDEPFGLISIHSGSDVQFAAWSASNQHFWLGKPTASYCPDVIDERGDCPDGNYTVFVAGDCTLGLADEVPGGQSVYVESTGALAFTEAHSNIIPDGAITDGFEIDSTGVNLNPPGDDSSFVACPVDAAKGVYQIFVSTGDDFDKFEDCIGIAAYMMPSDTEYGAWQYE